MDNDLKHLDLFDKYISNQLPEKEYLSFEQRLKTDAQFVDAFLLFNKTLQGIRDTEQKELKLSIHRIEEKLNKDGFFLDDDDVSDYISGTSNANLINQIERRREIDNSFENKIRSAQAIHHGIKDVEAIDLKKSIQETEEKLETEGFFQKEEKNQTRKIVSSSQADSRGFIYYLHKYWVAAAVLFLIAFGMIWLLSSQQQELERLYTNNYKTEDKLIYIYIKDSLARVGFQDPNKSRNLSLFNALELYQEKNFPAALSSLETHLNHYPEDHPAQFYKGICYMETNQFEAARTALHVLIGLEGFLWNYEVDWYYALLYLKLHRKATAKSLFQKIANDTNSVYQKDAKNIVIQL